MTTKTTTTTKSDKPTTGLRTCACAKCGEAFDQVKPWQTFCSDKCRTGAHQVDRYANDRKARRGLPKIGKGLDAIEATLIEFLAGKDPKFSQVEDALGAVRKLAKRVKALT